MASSSNSNPRCLAKRRSNSSPELQIHGMDCHHDDDSSSLPAMLKMDTRRPSQDQPGCSSANADPVDIHTDKTVPKICLDHIEQVAPNSNGYIGPVKESTEKTDADTNTLHHSNSNAPSQKSESDEEIKSISNMDETSKSWTKRRSNGLSRVASVIVSKFVRSSKKSERHLERDSESSSDNTDSPALQRGRSKSLSGRILRRFRDQSRDGSRDVDGRDSQTSTPKRRQSHRDTAKSGSERTRNLTSQGKATRRYRPIINFAEFDPREYPTENEEDIQRAIREREIKEGVDPPPGFQPQYFHDETSPDVDIDDDLDDLSASLETCTCSPDVERTKSAPVIKDPAVAPYPQLSSVVPEDMKEQFDKETAAAAAASCSRTSTPTNTPEVMYMTPHAHTQVDYMHCLVPDQLGIMNSCFYWGKIDRYEADEILENKPEGTFLLRDSSQEEFLFSVSFRRYGRTLHARIEQWKHKFSFDAHDPSVYSCDTICGLLEHYKDPLYCMFFEPMLTIPLPRANPPSLQELARSVICTQTSYDGINCVELPRVMKDYLKEYHYKQRVRVRQLDSQEQVASQKFVYKNVSNTCISR